MSRLFRCSCLALTTLLFASSLFAAEKEKGEPSTLAAEIERIEACTQRLAEIKDYSCKFVKRENIDGELGSHQVIYLRVRHEPFSAYMYFLAPDGIKGRQASYIDGENDGKLVALSEGLAGKLGPIRIPTDGILAMEDNRHPITNVGLLNLMTLLGEDYTKAAESGETIVRRIPAAVAKRQCTVTEIKHPKKQDNFKFHLSRIYFDNETDLPIRFEAYDWPADGEKEPPLLEEYTYIDLKIDQGLDDEEFGIRLQ